MMLHSHRLDISLEHMKRDVGIATDGWDWARGAHGHALSLPARHEVHFYNRYKYTNYPYRDVLDRCSSFREVFDWFQCPKLAFRLLRRGSNSAYSWHADRRKGPGVVRMQIPIVSNDRVFVFITDYTSSDQVIGPKAELLDEASVETLLSRNAGHMERHELEPGVLHYFNTSRVHTVVNHGDSHRITLAMDLLANDWLRERFPEVQAEAGDGSIPIPRPGRAARLVEAATARLTHRPRVLARRFLRR
jgi:hypothetical protein